MIVYKESKRSKKLDDSFHSANSHGSPRSLRFCPNALHIDEFYLQIHVNLFNQLRIMNFVPLN